MKQYMLAGWPRWVLGVTALALLLSGCKIRISATPDGRVVSTDGEILCAAGSVCVVEVSDTEFDKTFVAEPAPGFIFSHWKRGQGSFCGGNRGPCHLLTTGFAGTPLEAFLSTDDVFTLEPVFEPFNLAYWRRVLAEIGRGSQRRASFLYLVEPNPSLCDPGVLSDGARQRALRALNEVRHLHQLPPVTYGTRYDAQMQEAALVQRANNRLTHSPDPSLDCFSDAAEEGARTANLYLGAEVDPAAAVFSWTNDNFNAASLAEAGHRRWMLFPGLGQTAYGQVLGAASLKVFGFGSVPSGYGGPPAFVAMPYRIYPSVLVSQGLRATPWSLSVVPPVNARPGFDYFRDATVEVTKPPRGKRLTVHSLHSDTRRFGLDNFLSWMVDDWQYDTEYRVTVRGVRLPQGGTTEFAYPVVVVRQNLLDPQ